MVLFLVIVALAALSLIPALRSAPAASFSLESEALSVLDICRDYVAAHEFDTRLTGTIRAKVFGIPYTQTFGGCREVCGECFCETTESASAFVKAAVKKSFDGDVYTVARGERKNKAFVYGAPRILERVEYIAEYGMPAVGLVKYELNGSVASAERVGENEYRFVLDAARATEYTRNEVRTTLGGKVYPAYESVEFTLFTDGLRATKVTMREAFTIDKFGGTECVAEYTEVFIYD